MRALSLFALCLLLSVSAVAGCRKEKSASETLTFSVQEDRGNAKVADMDGNLARVKAEAGPVAEPAKAHPAKEPQATKGIARKIKYTAAIQLITEDFVRAETEVNRLVKTAQGYVATSEIKIAPGSIAMGFWKIRIPVTELDSFRQAVLKLGQAEKNATDSQDLTEEYYDLANNIKNRQAEEEALRKIMDKAADRMDNFFTIRHELNQVREDIDRKLGRLKLLAGLTDMTTISLTIREKQKYNPGPNPTLAEIPTFRTRLGKTYGDSMDGLIGFLQTIAIFLAAAAPWSPFFVAVGIASWIYVRRRKRELAALLAKRKPDAAPSA